MKNRKTIELMKDMFDDVKPVLDKLERDTKRDTSVGMISGGYAIAEIFHYDEQYYDVQLRWGVSSDCASSSHQEEYKIDRKTLEIKSISEVCVHNTKCTDCNVMLDHHELKCPCITNKGDIICSGCAYSGFYTEQDGVFTHEGEKK